MVQSWTRGEKARQGTWVKPMLTVVRRVGPLVPPATGTHCKGWVHAVLATGSKGRLRAGRLHVLPPNMPLEISGLFECHSVPGKMPTAGGNSSHLLELSAVNDSGGGDENAGDQGECCSRRLHGDGGAMLG